MSNPDHVTWDDLNMLEHFWGDYEDLERWADWEERKPVIEKEFPEIVRAWENYQIAKRTMTAVIRAADVEDDDDEESE